MSIRESLKKRRSYYNINKNLPVPQTEVIRLVEELTELVPDAFNMKSSRVVIALEEKQDQLWDKIHDVFAGKVPREKIDSFKAGAGTVLYFYDESVVKAMQEKFPSYAPSFPTYANQSSAMLQLSIWTGLREMGIGATVQHYNPVIDEAVKELLGVPQQYALVAQMPFGGIVSEPEAKEGEDIKKRVRTVRQAAE